MQGFKAREYLVVSRWNEFGIFIFLAYLAAAGFYFWARMVHTLDIGWTWCVHGCLVLLLVHGCLVLNCVG